MPATKPPRRRRILLVPALLRARHPAAPALRRVPPTAALSAVFLALFLAALPPPRATAQCHYTWIQLPRAGSLFTYGRAINNLGWVTGIATAGGEYDRGFIWRPDTGVSVLIPLPPGAAAIAPYDINDHGHVVGTMEVPGTGLGNVPFWWDGEQVHAIQMPPGTRNGWAYAINNRGQVVGQFEIIGSHVRAFLWEAGTFVDLGPLLGPQTSIATAINEHSHIGGHAYEGSRPRAFRFDSEVEWLSEPNGIVRSECRGLSNNGFVAGIGAYVPPGDPAYRALGLIWTPNGVHVIEAPLERQHAIFRAANDAGRAVGSYTWVQLAPIVWQNGVTTNLATVAVPPLPITANYATDINRSGQIVVWINGGSVLLTPVWVPGDLTGDCHVALDDLFLVLSNFGSPQGTFPRGDVDLDGDVDLRDLTILLSHWGE